MAEPPARCPSDDHPEAPDTFPDVQQRSTRQDRLHAPVLGLHPEIRADAAGLREA